MSHFPTNPHDTIQSLHREIERLQHNLQVTEQTRQEYEELAKLRLEEINRLRFALADAEALEFGTAERCERLTKQLEANNPLLDEAADKIDELEAKLKFAEETLQEIRALRNIVWNT